MQGKISSDLINISSKLLTATARGELVGLASELNAVIEKALEIENTGEITNNQKTLSATIKFTKEEIDMMSKTFKKEFIANGCVGRIIKRPSGKKSFCYEIRYRRNGYNISVSNNNIDKAKGLFIAATKHLETPETLAKNKLRFGTILDEWINYKRNKIARQTWQSYCTYSKRYFSEDLRTRPIADIRTADVDKLMQQFCDNPRLYEDMRTILNQTFKYAIASGIITHNPVTLVPFIRAERQTRERMTKAEILQFLQRLQDPKFNRIRQLAYVLYFFGLRPCEIDDEARFENGFLICRNRKRKAGKIEYKKIPVPKQARGLIDFDKPIKPELSYDRWLDLMKEALGKNAAGEDFTPYNLRHTFASTCAEAAKPEIVELWMGDSPERLVGKVYVHYSDEFMRAQMDKVKFITLSGLFPKTFPKR